MNRTIELIRLIAACDKIDGRKKLQKIVHILKEAGHPFDYRYGFHFHGPFSAELKGDIDVLVGEGLICEQEGPTDSGAFSQYSYSPSDAADNLLNHYGTSGPQAWESLAKSLNAKSPQELESISTLIYLIRHGNTGAHLGEQFKRLKPQLAAQFDSAKAFAEKVVR